MKLRSFFATAVALVAVTAQGQSLEWAVDYNTVFDNREGDNKIEATKTHFHTQLAPELGVSFMGGEHSIMGGAVWTQPVGCEWEGHRISPTVYYRYKGERWTAAFGMFPRYLMHGKLPNYIWSDSLNYSQHNLRGALVSYSGRNGYFEGIVDWRALQSETRREAFNIIVQGQWQRPQTLMMAGATAMMNHFALTAHPTPDQHIVDNFIYNPWVGLDLTAKTGLDSLAVRAGVLGCITRNRAESSWRTPAGAWVDITLRWKRFEWDNTFYAGRAIYPFYAMFGSLLDQGEPYYCRKWYDRTTVAYSIFDNKFVNMRASLDFNVAPDNFTFYQRLIVRVYIDSNFKSKGSGSKLKNYM